jgi:hypothetical protein
MFRTIVWKSAFGGAITAFLSAGMGLVAALGLGELLSWDKGSKTLVATIFAIIGFLLGGFRAGLLEPRAPLSNAAASGAIAGPVLALLQRLLADKPLNVLNLVFVGFMAASIATFGGFVANSSNRRNGRT